MNADLYKIYANSSIKKNVVPCTHTHNTGSPVVVEKASELKYITLFNLRHDSFIFKL